MVVNFVFHSMAAERNKIAVSIFLLISMAAGQAKAGENTVKYWCRKLYQHFCLMLGMSERKHTALERVPFPATTASCSLQQLNSELGRGGSKVAFFHGTDLEANLFCINFFYNSFCIFSDMQKILNT